jgi:putative lipoprotein
MPQLSVLAVLALLPVLAHAAATAPIDRITGSVTHRERVALPEDATLTIELLDVSRQDTRSDRLARLALPAGGRQVPLAFELPFYRADIKPAHRYAIRATLSSSGGELLFTTAQHVPVLIDGADRHVQLVLTQVQHTPLAMLENTYWKLVEVNGRPAQVLPGEREAHILLLAGRASGSSGCNKLMGSYAHNPPGALRIGPLASTRMACAPEMMAQESALLGTFEHATAYRIDGEALILLNGDAVLARFESRHFK